MKKAQNSSPTLNLLKYTTFLTLTASILTQSPKKTNYYKFTGKAKITYKDLIIPNNEHKGDIDGMIVRKEFKDHISLEFVTFIDHRFWGKGFYASFPHAINTTKILKNFSTETFENKGDDNRAHRDQLVKFFTGRNYHFNAGSETSAKSAIQSSESLSTIPPINKGGKLTFRPILTEPIHVDVTFNEGVTPLKNPKIFLYLLTGCYIFQTGIYFLINKLSESKLKTPFCSPASTSSP
jgi:hypothetical protein